MKTYSVYRVVIVALLALAWPAVALAHGQPVIAVQPAIVAAGGTVTVTGSEVEPGEVFALTLEGLAGSIPLGQATVKGEGEEAGFTATFNIPANSVPGSYTVRAATDEGEAASADLTVTASSDKASAGPAVVQEATSAPHLLDRTKPLGQVIGATAAAVVSGALGLWLVLRRAG